eukprot:TRINITY_DN6282_c0_g1_i4.p2 TRINITY_DN6282_c0_g1~~TRINITY_DN6282_c0_g1_i4.p2  ORF type:complete len:107 (-),score=28.19 TRINITY_DN6282_c0_g1_i4:278-598(-)
MIRRPPRSTLSSSSAASDVYKRQGKINRLEARRYLQEQEADGMGAVHNLFSDGDNSRKAQFWAKYDANGDGFVTFREFLACRLAIARYSSEELARTERAMQQYDDR